MKHAKYILMVLALLTCSCHQLSPEDLQEKKDIVVAGRCRGIVATGKRHESFIFTIDVSSIRHGDFTPSTLGFELYHDGGGVDLLRALSVQRTSNRDKPLAFDTTSVLVLTIKPIPEPYTLRETRVNANVMKWEIEAKK